VSSDNSISVFKPNRKTDKDGTSRNEMTISIAGQPKRIISFNNPIDIAFIIDTTGSMSDKIEALISMAVKFVELPAKYNLDPQFLLVSFGDLKVWGDKIELVCSLTENTSVIKKSLREIPRNGGGANSGESSFEAIKFTLDQDFRKESIKVFVLITDEPAHVDNISPKMLYDVVLSSNFLAYVLSPDEYYYKELAKRFDGEWSRISAQSNLDSLKKLFESIAVKVSQRADDIFKLTGGDVPAYRKLTSGKS
jgi:hypothetical protein